jgi:hypothetical protein
VASENGTGVKHGNHFDLLTDADTAAGKGAVNVTASRRFGTCVNCPGTVALLPSAGQSLEFDPHQP